MEVESVLVRHSQHRILGSEATAESELTLQIPHATVHSSLVADAWLA